MRLNVHSTETSDAPGGATAGGPSTPQTRMRKKHSLRTTLLLMLLTAMGPLLLLGAASGWYQWQLAVKEVSVGLENTASAMALAIDGEIHRADSVLTTLAASELIDRKDWRSFHRVAVEATRREPDTFVALTERSGVQPVRTMLPYGAPPVNPLAIARQQSEIQWNGRTLPLSTQGLASRVFASGKLANSGLYYGVSTHRPSVAIASPVVREGRTAYVLIKTFTTEPLVKLLQGVGQPHVRVTLIDAHGRIIARNHDPDEAIGRKVSDTLLQLVSQADRGVREGINLDGQATLTAFKRLSNADWFIHVSVPQSTALAGARQNLLISLVLGLALLVFSVLGARRFWLRLTPAITRLGQSARAIQRGEAVELPESRITEVDQLVELVSEAALAERRERDEITLRKVAEQSERETRKLVDQLTQSESRFRLLFEHAGVGLALVNPASGQFMLVNDSLCAMTGYSRDELTRLSFADILHPEDSAANLAGTHAIMRSERTTYDVEKRYIRKDGSICWVELHVRGFPSTFSDHPMAFASITDITERKLSAMQMQEADRRKDEFIAALAHELRNPLAPIRSGVEILKRQPDASVAARTTAMMQRQVAHMVRLIDDLLDVSRITTGRLELKAQPVDLAELVSAAVESCQPMMQEHAHTLTVDIDDAPLIVHGDSARLVQVINNLLVNAAKYTPSGGGQIRLRAWREGGQALISVRDNGMGIPQEKLADIFELFLQLQPLNDRGTGAGLGIGLHLVRRLVDLHGGTVVARSGGPGTGAEFTVSIPLLEAAIAAGEVAVPATSNALHILVVDDNRDAADSLATILRLHGHTVVTAYDGESAIALAQSSSPRLMFLDLGMPGIDGFEVCRAVRAVFDSQSMTIIALTGWGQDADRKKSREAGFDGHLVKPVEVPELERLVQSLID